MSKDIHLTRDELQTIVEDAFIDGWKQGQESDWYDAEDFLYYHMTAPVDEQTHSETTLALIDLKAGV